MLVQARRDGETKLDNEGAQSTLRGKTFHATADYRESLTIIISPLTRHLTPVTSLSDLTRNHQSVS